MHNKLILIFVKRKSYILQNIANAVISEPSYEGTNDGHNKINLLINNIFIISKEKIALNKDFKEAAKEPKCEKSQSPNSIDMSTNKKVG